MSPLQKEYLKNTFQCSFVCDRLEVSFEIEVFVGSQEREVHVLAESLKTVEDTETGATVESGHVKEASVVEPGKDNLAG